MLHASLLKLINVLHSTARIKIHGVPSEQEADENSLRAFDGN